MNIRKVLEKIWNVALREDVIDNLSGAWKTRHKDGYIFFVTNLSDWYTLEVVSDAIAKYDPLYDPFEESRIVTDNLSRAWQWGYPIFDFMCGQPVKPTVEAIWLNYIAHRWGRSVATTFARQRWHHNKTLAEALEIAEAQYKKWGRRSGIDIVPFRRKEVFLNENQAESRSQ